MSALNVKAFVGLANLVLVLGALLFVPAWTLDYWQAWAFLAVFTVGVVAVTAYLIRHDPKLLARRTQAGPIAEKQRTQQIGQSLASLAFVALFVTASLDHRFGWSVVPALGSVLGDVVVAFGLYAVHRVFRENTFASATIEVDAGQHVVSSGPYAIVRHPMYSGALVMLAGVPLALGSYWALLPFVAMIAVIVRRLLDEERVLATDLAGYTEYQRTVRSRLVPRVW